MGLDGGTYITRSDVLRGQSWELATADNSRSTRGGNASTTAAKDRNVVDPRTVRYKSHWLHTLQPGPQQKSAVSSGTAG